MKGEGEFLEQPVPIHVITSVPMAFTFSTLVSITTYDNILLNDQTERVYIHTIGLDYNQNCYSAPNFILDWSNYCLEELSPALLIQAGGL